jgi:hypothetical protein
MISSSFLSLPEAQRKRVIEEGAVRRSVSPVIMEKDFWVCWMLSVLFQSDFAESLVFKGGTSLSKVFGAIERFSEDIDLSLSPDSLDLPEAGTSRNQANKWMKRAEAACTEMVRNRILPELNVAVNAWLGSTDGIDSSTDRIEFQLDSQTNSPILLFHYPTTQPAGFDYLKRSVKLEFGSLTEQRPTGRHAISPWLGEAFPQLFEDWKCEVVALEIERTFWEKATILHAEYHRPEDKPTPDRFSRHYADTVALANHPDGKRAIELQDGRARVVGWKARFFGSSWARYDLAVPGSFRLVPSANRVEALRRDYQVMRDMYLAEPITFDLVLEQLGKLERKINHEPS